jgi:predicted secreted Zn-dependent protease
MLATPIQLVALEPMYVDVGNAEERHYRISGTSPDLLVASAIAGIPADPSGAARHTMAYAGPIVWQHVPSYTIDSSSQACTMTGVASTVRYQATVPVWTSPASVRPELVAWWQQVLEHIRVHEGEHVRIFEAYVGALPGRVAGQPCGSWDAIVNAWTAEIEAAQAAFDATEAGWALPAYAGPPDG